VPERWNGAMKYPNLSLPTCGPLAVELPEP
jgi:hypothetical protein